MKRRIENISFGNYFNSKTKIDKLFLTGSKEESYELLNEFLAVYGIGNYPNFSSIELNIAFQAWRQGSLNYIYTDQTRLQEPDYSIMSCFDIMIRATTYFNLTWFKKHESKKDFFNSLPVQQFLFKGVDDVLEKEALSIMKTEIFTKYTTTQD